MNQEDNRSAAFGNLLHRRGRLRHAIEMLTRLQGSTHRVITGVALVDAATAKEKAAHAVSTVTMRRLTVKEIAALASKHQDKAGAYAVQEKKDALVTRVRLLDELRTIIGR